MKILVASSEVFPLAKTGGLADVAGALPKALSRLGHDVAVILPLYRAVIDSKIKLKPIVKHFQVPMGMGEITATLWVGTLPQSTVKVYAIQNDRYFDREFLYGTPEGDYVDNAERFAFFSRAVLEALKQLNWYPDVLQLNDWQTGLIACYLKTLYSSDNNFSKTKTFFAIHNLAYQGAFPKYVLPMTGISWDEFKPDKLEFYDQVNFMKAGLVYSDAITTVSESYASEIQTDEMGCGLQGVLRERATKLHGILNGLDYSEWNPEFDKELPAHFNGKKISGKTEIKKLFLKEEGLVYEENTPLLGMVTRLADQKGLDLLSEIIDSIMEMDIQIAVLGFGDLRYHQMFTELKKKYPEKVIVHLKYDNRISKMIYAASDMFLMPSRYEPCGLGQLISMKYGTIPLVRHTGGLADTVSDITKYPSTGTGFSFTNYESKELQSTIQRSFTFYQNKIEWKALVQRVMSADFSWDASAKKYIQLFESV